MAEKRRQRDERERETDESEVEIVEEQPKAKKKRYSQKYRPEYHSKNKHIVSSSKGACYAYCTACRFDFSIAHGGLRDVTKHLERASHKSNENGVKGERSISNFFQLKDADNEEQKKKTELELQVTKAEAAMCRMIADCNLSLSSAERFTSLFQYMFPDSKIAASKWFLII